MSKSLGNVLDPFEVLEELRHRCAALLPDARGRVRRATATSASTVCKTRYDSELANEYGNLASRTVAMIAPLPRRQRAAGRDRPGDRGGVRGLAEQVARLLRSRRDDPGARRDLAARAAPEPLRRGAPALAAGQGREQGRRARGRRWRRCTRASAWSRCCCTRTSPRAPRSCSRRSARPTLLRVGRFPPPAR